MFADAWSLHAWKTVKQRDFMAKGPITGGLTKEEVSAAACATVLYRNSNNSFSPIVNVKY